MNLDYLYEFATERQKIYLDAVKEHGSNIKAASALGVGRRSVDTGIKRAKAKAASKAVAPEADVNKRIAEGFHLKGASNYYNKHGELSGQWLKSDKDSKQMAEAFMGFVDEYVEELPKYVPKPSTEDYTTSELMTCYIIGDHHLGMAVRSNRNGNDSWNIESGVDVLTTALHRLIKSSPSASTGMLVNLGDFLHANDSTNLTQSGNVLDVDGCFADAYEAAGRLFRTMVDMMLAKHDKVVIMNARGNHDRDSSLMLNIFLKAFYENEPRVEVVDNTRKLVSYQFGKNLIASHHGDRMKPQSLYEQITRTMPKVWGDTEYRFAWMGHIHHKTAQEIGGLSVESWNVLPPPDGWHSDSGYGSERSMSCVVLNKYYGEDVRFKVGIEEIKNASIK